MPGDPYYRTPEWQLLRAAILKRDGYRCIVPGCDRKANIVDHIISRSNGNGHADTPNNLRSLCRDHDNQMKELRGKRRSMVATVKGCTADGRPNDPNHPWHQA